MSTTAVRPLRAAPTAPATPGAAAVPPVPWARVAGMDRSLDFYLGLGCEVRQASDGWVLLSCGADSFVLVGASAPAPGSGTLPVGSLPVESLPVEPGGEEPPWLRLSTRDVRAMRRRLRGEGVATGVLQWSARRSTGQIVVVDPDRRSVLIAQRDPRDPAHRRPARNGEAPVDAPDPVEVTRAPASGSEAPVVRHEVDIEPLRGCRRLASHRGPGPGPRVRTDVDQI